MVAVARQHGLGPLKQMREMYRLRYGPGRLALHEYFSSGAFRPELSPTQKLEFVGKTGSYEVNVAASPMKLTGNRSFLRDKVMYGALLQQLGLPTPETQAVVHRNRHFGNMQTLRGAGELIAFLRGPARYPLFAKPCEGAGAVGSALIAARGGDLLRLGNGRAVDLEGFALEVVSDYPEGFILQSAIEQHPAMSAMTGQAVGTLRVVTVRDKGGIRPLYTIWKVPSPRAMSDNFWQSGSMVALVDDKTGRVRQCNIGTGLNAEWVETHPVSGQSFPGFEIPFWDEVQSVALRGHGLFPEFGIVGWDIAIGPDGPMIIECNDNPYHVLWQLAAGRGFLNIDFKARLDAATECSNAMLKGRIETYQKRQAMKRRAA
jgi:hypothetical protein